MTGRSVALVVCVCFVGAERVLVVLVSVVDVVGLSSIMRPARGYETL